MSPSAAVAAVRTDVGCATFGLGVRPSDLVRGKHARIAVSAPAAPLPLPPPVFVFALIDVPVREGEDALPMLHVALPVAHVLLSIGGEEGFTLAMFFSFTQHFLLNSPGNMLLKGLRYLILALLQEDTI